jgi:hypothetical protein
VTFWRAYGAIALTVTKGAAFGGICFGGGLYIGRLIGEGKLALAIAALAGVVCAAIGMGAWQISRDDRR